MFRLLYFSLIFGLAGLSYNVRSFGSNGKPVLRVLASLQDVVISDRNNQASYIVDRALFGGAKYTELSYGSPEFNSVLNRLTIEWMVYKEALTFGVAEVSAGDLNEATKKVKVFLSKNKKAEIKLKELEVDDSEIVSMAERKLRANRFIKYKTNSSFIQVGDEEAREYFNKNRLKFGTGDFDQFRASIKLFLGKRNSEDRLKEWFDVLRKKHKLKLLSLSN